MKGECKRVEERVREKNHAGGRGGEKARKRKKNVSKNELRIAGCHDDWSNSSCAKIFGRHT